MTSTKKWYTRRRYWTLALLAILVYFCLIPSPLRISPETTGYTEPLLPNGDVDYFAVYEKMYIDKLSPPEDNGYRLLLAACGPRILEQNAMMNKYAWGELPTGEDSKQWFHEKWIPLCEHMYIDPYIKPRFLDLLDFYGFMKKEWEANNQDEKAKYEYKEDDNLRQKLAATPWTAEEYPVFARWLEQRTPVLDLFGVAVRKPNYGCYRWREDTLIAILLPDVQATRAFARDVQVRITERLGKGDVDGAWDDAMSMFYLSRKHFINDPIIVTNLVGIAIESMGWESAKIVLQHGNLTAEQLERFAKDLDSLPRKPVLDTELDRCVFPYNILKVCASNRRGLFVSIEMITSLSGDDSSHRRHWYWPTVGAVAFLPVDRNIAGKRMAENIQAERRIIDDSAWNISPTVMRKAVVAQEQVLRENAYRAQFPWGFLRVPLIRTRSQLFADYIFDQFTPALQAAQNALDSANTRLELLRMIVALERYKSDNENYPETLDALIPKYLEEVPLDPLTGRLSWTYKLAPDAETAVLLHSSEWDGGGKNSNEKNLFIRIAR